MDKLEEEEDKKTNGAVVANDQRNAEAEIDEEEGSADSDVNEGDSAHNNEEDDESQVTWFNALALQARDSSTIFSKPNKLYAAFWCECLWSLVPQLSVSC